MEYSKKEGKLEVREVKEIIQSFTLEQIEEMILNTQAQKILKEQELVFINNSLTELAKLKNEAIKLGIELEVKEEKI